ncbi:MAG TPA: hypothetical protein VK053_11210 [Jiangellaceae bacterium]|uniref:hypothetical protein n=2 Tax=Micrococcales TaxID=85006 RepID=UPI002D128C63|nr:hypothetical protein [Georgenia sp. H159]HLR95087.1 hypothetical protein [Jiangellaceae bacterium]
MKTPTGLSSDETQVAAFTTDSHETTSRVFLPADGPAGAAMTWRELTAHAGVPLTADLRWSVMVRRLDAALQRELTPPFAVASPATLRRLVDVLSAATSTPGRCYFFLWPGYAGDIDDLDPEVIPPHLSALAGRDHVLHTAPLSWLLERTEDTLDPRLPVFVWPHDGAFLLACPLYHDSLYVSGAAALLEAMRSDGLEVLPIARNIELPGEGD